MTAPLQQVLAELKAELEKLYGERLVRVILYGSQARGDALPDSDIDILVILKAPVKESAEEERISYIASELSIRHRVVICVFVFSQGDFEHREDSFFREVRREGISL